MSDKAPVFQEQEFTVQEGVLYRICRTGAIWSNKLFFSCLFLLGLWVLIAFAGGTEACTQGTGNGTMEDVAAIEEGTCSPFLTPTSTYLGAMAVFSFVASIVFGLLGLVVGKNIVQMTKADDEVGAPQDPDKP